MFSLVCHNLIDSSHQVEVHGTTIDYNIDSNIPPVSLDIEQGTTVTAWVKYSSADFTIAGWNIDGWSQPQEGELPPIRVLDLNGNPFNSAEVSSTTVAGPLTENRITFKMPAANLPLFPMVFKSDAVGVSPETRIDMNGINEVEFNGENINKLYIDGVLQWDASLPAGNRFVDATAGITFLVGD